MAILWALRERAKTQGVTGYKLAALTGLTRQTVYHLMREPRADRIDCETLDLLCAALNCEPGDLLERDAKRPPRAPLGKPAGKAPAKKRPTRSKPSRPPK